MSELLQRIPYYVCSIAFVVLCHITFVRFCCVFFVYFKDYINPCLGTLSQKCDFDTYG